MQLNKILFGSLMIFGLPALADVTITAAWTPAPDPQGLVTGQEVIHDPDTGIAGDEVVIQTLAPGVAGHSFTLTGADRPNDALIINTLFQGAEVKSDPMPILCIAGATITTVIQNCN